MQLRTVSLSLLALCLTLAAVPAMAQTIYSNGPTNGNTDAWTINFGFVVSDTFNTNGPDASITGLSFSTWMFPGDVLGSAEVSITSSENGGTSYFDSTVNFTQSGCAGNSFGYNICTETGAFDVNLASQGTYWLNLQNASVASGDPVYWDENSGPSLASENSVGTIPSESFTVLGTNNNTTTTSTLTTGTPEPNDWALLVSGFIGLTAVLRRKLF